MSSDTADRPRRKKKEKNPNFWRAIRFLAPYRGMVVVSVLCAVMVSAVFTSGLGAMLPIFKVLLEDQTVARWMDHQIVEHRLGVKLAEAADDPAIAKVSSHGAAARMGLKPGEKLSGALALANPAVTSYQGHP